MSNKIYPFVYNAQLKTYIGQFMRAFSGYQIDSGKKDQLNQPILERVTVRYGAMDRIVVSILNKRETFTNRKLPFIGVVMSGIAPNKEQRRNPRHVDELSTEGKEAQRAVVKKTAGVPLTLNMEVTVYASSTQELFSIIEQIILQFNPRMTIRIRTSALDMTTQTDISLNDINSEITYPIGTDMRTVAMTLGFSMNAVIEYPKIRGDNFIDTITKTIYPVPDVNDIPENVVLDGIEEIITEADT